VSKKGLPIGIKMRHDSHYVEELSRTHRSIGKIIPINKIEPNPEQPRTEIGDLTELTNSIKQNGVLEPLLVKPNSVTGIWMIIAGERRWRASNLAGLQEVPCIEMDLDDKTIAEVALIENLQRKDLNIWEEADGLKALGDKFGYTHEEIAKKISKSRTTVTESMTIAGLPENIRERCREANISAKSTLLEIARQFDEAAMFDFLDTIRNQSLRREEIRRTARPNTQKVDQNKPSPQLDSAIKAVQSKAIFNFAPENSEFSLQISFGKPEFSKNDVLKALKETFDKIKADGVN
jgi:ParB family transcriptional regulator, chromosome partitioning protein